MNKEKQVKLVNIAVDAEMHKQFRSICMLKGMTMKEAIEKLMNWYVDQELKKIKGE